MSFARDSGVVEILRTLQDGREVYESFICILDAKLKSLRIRKGGQEEENKECLFKIMNVSKVDVNETNLVFKVFGKVGSELNAAVTFRCMDEPSLQSWVASIRANCITKDKGRDLLPLFERKMIVPFEKREESAESQIEAKEVPSGPELVRLNSKDSKRICGLSLVFSPPVSYKWRETFVMLMPGGIIAELTEAVSGKLLFEWQVGFGCEIRLQRNYESSDRLEILLEPVELKNEISASDVAVSSLTQFALRIAGHSDRETYAWAAGLHEWRSSQSQSPISSYSKPRAMSRYCAKSLVSWGGRSSSRAAEALTLILSGPSEIKASRTPTIFNLDNTISHDAAVLKEKLSARLIQGEGTGIVHRSIEKIGLELAKTGEIVQTEDYRLEVHVECSQAAQYRLLVQFNGFHVFGSPLRLKVIPGVASAAHCTIGDIKCQRDDKSGSKVFQLTVERRDSCMNLLDSLSTHDEDFHVKILDGSPGNVVSLRGIRHAECIAHVVIPGDSEETSVSVKLGEQEVRDSPLDLVYVNPSKEADDGSILSMERIISKLYEKSDPRTFLKTEAAEPVMSAEALPQYERLSRMLEPLAEIASASAGALTAKWKDFLAKHPHLPPLDEPVALSNYLQNLSAAIAQSALPNQQILLSEVAWLQRFV